MGANERRGVIKGITILVLVLLLLIPLSLISGTINERKYRHQETENNLIYEFGGEQILNAPMLIVPYVRYNYDINNKFIGKEELKAYFLPDYLNSNVDTFPEVRSRGIYDFLLYKGDISFSGNFIVDFENIDGRVDEILWDMAYLELEISNMKGLTSKPEILIDNKNVEFKSEHSRSGIFNGGVAANIKLDKNLKNISFSGKYSFQGGRSLSFVPLARENNFTINSTWEYPSFFGAYLPNGKEIVQGQGFTSDYSIVSYNSDYKPAMNNLELEMSDYYSSYFGVKYIFPVDVYQLSERSIKYGMLFIILPFLVFFLFEVFTGVKVHPFQYMFVGITSSIFFLLLIAISEHFGFLPGYISGSISVSILITYYSSYFLKSFKRAAVIFPVMGLSYFFMYQMINSQDYALLMGAIGLFILIAGVMITTRKVDWYNFGNNKLTK